ncbi:MAG: NAD-dependent epimerase/dehydratase family protein [Pseudomonadota bacterium]|nr:NAD-dependent epimerase/dehydratase family protein [Pseudomonadota bacterium]
MKIFVTGASGFVGGAFVREAGARHVMAAMSRSEKSDAKITALGAMPTRCDLSNVSAEHLKGCAAVMHCAAYVEEWGPWSAYWRANVEGTRRLLDAAKKAGVKRFVHIGTEAALLKGQDLIDVNETYPLALDSPFPYSRTKAHAEKAVREANDPARGFETIVVRPRFVWGPGDETLLPILKRMSEAGRFAWIDGGRHRTSTSYIGNLVYAMELALTKGRGGEAYFVLDDGGPVSFRDFLPRMADAAGFELKGREVSGWLARSIAFLAEKAWRTLPLSGAPPLTRFGANILSRECILVDAKARVEMGYAPPFTREQGLAALAASG